MKRDRWILPVLLLALALPAAAGGMNSSIRIDSGDVVNNDLSTLNGSIQIDDRATVNGSANTVNGSIEVGKDVQIDELSTVNGGIVVGVGTIVDGEVNTINGSIAMESGTRAKAVATINGGLNLRGASVDKDVSTYNGDVTLSDGTNVGGDIIIREASSRSSRRDRPLRIYVESGSTVQGNLIVEDDEMEVELYLRGGSIAGEIRGAKVVEK